MHSDTQPDTLRTMVFSAVVTALTVLLSPVFSFPLGVTRAFPIQHMANIFLAVLAGGKPPRLSRLHDRRLSLGMALQPHP